jgi:hypothetical protein
MIVWLSEYGYGKFALSGGWTCTACGATNEESDDVIENFLRGQKDVYLQCRNCKRKSSGVRIDGGNGGKIK